MSLPVLYIKSGCPWCTDALNYFAKAGLNLDVKDVRKDPAAMKRMQSISGQSLTPTFEYGDFMVADFSVDEFKAALKPRQDIAAELKLN